MKLTYRYRVKSLTGLLNKQARAVSYVWNYCNDVQKHALRWGKRWPSAYELMRLTSGTSTELRLHSSTINQVCDQYVSSRIRAGRPYLRYRGKKALGWVPIKGSSLKRSGDGFVFAGCTYRVFESRPLPEGKICDRSSFSRDSRGNWYLNIVMDIPDAKPRILGVQVGIDLGLKDFATLSTGEKIANPRYYRQLEQKLGIAQRARKKRTAAKISAKIANRRKDSLHKLSTRLAKEFNYIAVGDINAAGLAKTSMAKSVNDAGWSIFRTMLAYKAIKHGATYEEVDERFSTQACSACGCISGPKGRAGLNERQWVCTECGCEHDRDHNSAVNLLLRSGHRAPVLGAAA